MKLTKTQLKQIIREEINNVVKEWTIGGFGTGNKELFDAIRKDSWALRDAMRDALGKDSSSTTKDLENFRASARDLWDEIIKNKKTFNDRQLELLQRMEPGHPHERLCTWV
jgi:hypothetical protein